MSALLTPIFGNFICNVNFLLNDYKYFTKA